MSEEEEDELGRLMEEINEQAAIDLQASSSRNSGVKRKGGTAQPPNQSSKHKRSEQQRLQVENLKMGIETPLDAQNKGFKLLAKFGYTGSGGLGADGQGRQESIKLDTVDVGGKEKKLGLGVKEGVLRKRKELLEKRRLTSEEKRKVEATFRTTVSRKVSQKALGIDVDKAQRSIQFLDEKASVRRHELWPRDGNAHMATESSECMVDRGLYYSDDGHDGGDNDDDDDDIQQEEEELNADKLVACLEYLRRRYFYCLYCGCAYNDDKDLANSCPGALSDDH